MPKEDIFFDLLKNQVQVVCETGTLFGRILTIPVTALAGALSYLTLSPIINAL